MGTEVSCPSASAFAGAAAATFLCTVGAESSNSNVSCPCSCEVMLLKPCMTFLPSARRLSADQGTAQSSPQLQVPYACRSGPWLGLPRQDCSHYRSQASGPLPRTLWHDACCADSVLLPAMLHLIPAPAALCTQHAAFLINVHELSTASSYAGRRHAHEMLAMQVLARYDESCAVVRDQKLDPDLLTEQQKSPKAASMPLHQERVLVHRCAVILLWPSRLTMPAMTSCNMPVSAACWRLDCLQPPLM